MDYKGFTEFESRDFDALNLYLRSVGTRALKDLETLDVNSASWDDLHKTRKAAVSAAKASLRGLEGGGDETECRKASAAHDLLMAALDYIDGEMDRRKSLGQTAPLTPEQRGAPVPANGSVDCGTGRFVPAGEERGVEWRDERGAEVRVVGLGQRLATERYNGPGVGDMARAMIFGPKTDAERRALSEGTDSAGGYTVPENLAKEFIDKLRAQTVVFEAGARIVELASDNLHIARLATDPTVAWTAENAEITASDPTFERVSLVPKKLAALVKVSRELLEDSINIGEMLDAAFRGAMATELDRASLFGSGASNQPTGLFNVSGINSVSMGANGAIPTNYDNLIDLLYEVQVDNGANPKAFVMHPRTNATYAKLKDGQNNPLNEPKMTADVRRLLTTAVPIDQTQGTATGVCSTVLTGDFAQMLVGIRMNSLELRRLDQRYAEFDQVGFLARFRMDVAVTNPVHFGKLIGIKAS